MSDIIVYTATVGDTIHKVSEVKEDITSITNKNPDFRYKAIVVNTEMEKEKALNKLTLIDKLVLGL